MTNYLEITIPLDFIDDAAYIHRRILEKAPEAAGRYRIMRRSIDARRKLPHFVLQVAIDPASVTGAPQISFRFQPVHTAASVIIVGAGPAGYFAALELIERGIKPIVLEQGEDVHARRKRIARILRDGSLDPTSNYCFGEGGAGTFSDGKLYTRATKRGDIGKILQLLVFHGASTDILMDAHPHIGSNKLPAIVRRIRETILSCGGEVRFNTRVTGFLLESDEIKGVLLADGARVSADAVILATGHSARDIYHRLHDNGILIEAKPLAVGVRVEHPQALIDAMRYHHQPRHPKLPAATYRLVCQCDGRGVYSFCMCPGGYIVPTATAPNELAINGMSFSGRNGPFGNAGVVVELRPEDLGAFQSQGPFAMMAFQQALEGKTFEMGGAAGQIAPAQRMTDFIKGRISGGLPKTSYLPGVVSSPLHELLPPAVVRRLQEAFGLFNRKLKGFITEEALLVAVESRTSAPVRIPRNPETLMHPQVARLFPCGEGAGYAGGIVSSAMDGQQVAQRVTSFLKNGQ
ncbi:MAG: FAD-dependent oxidoreductase [Pseudomonadota bacterium]